MKLFLTCRGSLVLCSLLFMTGCNHKVLVAGGSDNNGNFLNSAEAYDPSTGTFTLTANTMSTGRLTATATTLPDNTILVAGGQGPTALNTADLYQPVQSRFTLLGNQLNHIRVAHTATLLEPALVSGPLSGSVLITGGDPYSVAGTAEIYKPSTGTFSNTANMTTSRAQHTAVLISYCGCSLDGKVLVVGGYDNQYNVLASAEIYDPVTQTFTATGSMNSPRFRHTATLLQNGTVLIAGGASQMQAKSGDVNPALNLAEIYDPKTGTFTSTAGPMTTEREAHAASLLQDGTVLLTGGQDAHFLIENTAELYHPDTKTFTPVSSAGCAGVPPPSGCMLSSRDFHISMTLDDGRVLIAGGINSTFNSVASAEIYSPATQSFTRTGSLSVPRSGAAATLVFTESGNPAPGLQKGAPAAK